VDIRQPLEKPLSQVLKLIYDNLTNKQQWVILASLWALGLWGVAHQVLHIFHTLPEKGSHRQQKAAQFDRKPSKSNRNSDSTSESDSGARFRFKFIWRQATNRSLSYLQCYMLLLCSVID